MNEKQIDKKAIEEMAKHCAYYHNGNCKNTHPFVEECDLMCDMFGTFANLEKAGYRKQSEDTLKYSKDTLECEWKLGKSGCMYFCSKCNYAAHPREEDEWNYCPNCGAKMKGGAEG